MRLISARSSIITASGRALRTVGTLRMHTIVSSGRVYIVSTLFWLWLAEGMKPDKWDALGAAVCVAGAAIILWGPRTA